MKKTTKKTVKKAAKKTTQKPNLSKYNAVEGKLNPLVKRSWISALRSGKYQQTRSCLCGVDSVGDKSYCCLGVLCEVLKKKGFNIKLKIDKETSSAVYVYKKKEEDGALPDSLALKIGLTANDSLKQDVYSNMNDSEGLSFKQIARYIENNE